MDSPLFPESFQNVPCFVDGCIEAWATSFAIDGRIFSMTFESVHVSAPEYGPFCAEQCLECEQLVLVKFDNAFNVEPQDQFKRIPAEHGLTMVHMNELARALRAGIARFLRDHNPTVIIGMPNDAQLAQWYAWLTKRFLVDNHLIQMRRSSYHPHKVLVIHRV